MGRKWIMRRIEIEHALKHERERLAEWEAKLKAAPHNSCAWYGATVGASMAMGAIRAYENVLGIPFVPQEKATQ
jgi:hypothetical protein